MKLSQRRCAALAIANSVNLQKHAIGILVKMSYDDVEIEDMEWNEELKAFTYPCPCGDLFQITKAELKIGEEIARCPSCSLYITVVYNMEDFQDSAPSQILTSSEGASAIKVS